MIRRLTSVLWLTAVWVALWEDLTWANALGGVAAAVAVTWVVPLTEADFDRRLRPLALLKLAVHFSWKLAEASAILAWEVLTPRNRINAAVVSIPLTTRSPGVATLVANMVSLTPGTLTLDVDAETMTLFVHVLHLESVGASRAEVLHLEQLAVGAFPHLHGEGVI